MMTVATNGLPRALRTLATDTNLVAYQRISMAMLDLSVDVA